MKVLFVVSRRRDENWWGKSKKRLMKEVATQRGENSNRWQWEETVWAGKAQGICWEQAHLFEAKATDKQGWRCVLGPDGTGLWMPGQGVSTLFGRQRESPEGNEIVQNFYGGRQSDNGKTTEGHSTKAESYVGDYCIKFRELQQGIGQWEEKGGGRLWFFGPGKEGRFILTDMSYLEGFCFVTFLDSHGICLVSLTVKVHNWHLWLSVFQKVHFYSFCFFPKQKDSIW